MHCGTDYGLPFTVLCIRAQHMADVEQHVSLHCGRVMETIEGGAACRGDFDIDRIAGKCDVVVAGARTFIGSG